MSRPEKPIDWDRVDKLLEVGCPGTEIASCFDMHPDTFYRRVEEKHGMGFTEYSSQKKSNGDAILKEAQFDLAMKGNVTMLIWLGKQRLGQHEPGPVVPEPKYQTIFNKWLENEKEIYLENQTTKG